MVRSTSQCVALAVLLLAGSGVDGATIRGVPSCAYWLQDREPGGHSSYFNAMWLVGYLSGAAVHSEKDILSTVDSESIAVWMDNYCKANASRNVAEGGEALFNEMARRFPPDKAGDGSSAPTSTAKLQPVEPRRPVSPSSTPTESVAASTGTPAPVAAELSSSTTPLPGPVKVSAKAPAEPDTLPRTESRSVAVNAPSYLPRALMLANTLPLTNSKYQFTAEQFARANGCVSPAATMNIKTATSETFAVRCAGGAALSVRCDPDCRDLQ